MLGEGFGFLRAGAGEVVSSRGAWRFWLVTAGFKDVTLLLPSRRDRGGSKSSPSWSWSSLLTGGFGGPPVESGWAQHSLAVSPFSSHPAHAPPGLPSLHCAKVSLVDFEDRNVLGVTNRSFKLSTVRTWAAVLDGGPALIADFIPKFE